MSRVWFSPGRWDATDLDFMVETPSDHGSMRRRLQDVLVGGGGIDDGLHFDVEAMQSQTIWQEARHPGARVVLTAASALDGERVPLQVDFSFGDPIAPPPVHFAYPTALGPCPVRAVRPETSCGWKFFGLFERSSDRWRPKDLFGLYWLLEHETLDLDGVAASIRATFDARGIHLSLASRFFEGAFATSRQSAQRWRSFVHAHPSFAIPDDVRTVVEVVARRLRPIFLPLLEATTAVRISTATSAAPTPVALTPGGARFPVIDHLEDVLPAILGRSEFVRIERGGHTILDYRTPSKYTFPPPETGLDPHVATLYAMRRECRGLVFDPTGRLVARKFHKFFAHDERPEARLDTLDWSTPCHVLEKLDGSLVAPVWWHDRIVWTTRRGPSPIAEQAAAHVDDRTRAFVTALLADGFTPLFEWCSPQHRIVLAHARSRLLLTAIRHNRTGAYLDVTETLELAARHGQDHVSVHGTLEDPVSAASFVRHTHAQREGEGYVLRFPDGRMVKVKTARYLDLHRIVAHPNRQAHLWRAVLSGEIDECLSALPPSEQRWVAELQDALATALAGKVRSVDDLVRQATLALSGREVPSAERRFATEYALALDPLDRAVAFAAWRGMPTREALADLVLRHLRRRDGPEALRVWLRIPHAPTLGAVHPKRSRPPAGDRAIVVGDVHGCLDELQSLLSEVGLSRDDHLVFVGDLVDQGPDSVGVVHEVIALRRRGYIVDVVRGNHEHRHLLYRAAVDSERHAVPLEPEAPWQTLARAWNEEELAVLRDTAWFCPLPRHRALVVHAGVPGPLRAWASLPSVADVPTLPRPDLQRFADMAMVRFERREEEAWLPIRAGDERPGDRYWADAYDGRFGHVYYGHHPCLDGQPRRWSHATGLDLGCVTGGRLAAAILASSGDVAFVTVAAQRAYCEPWQPRAWAEHRFAAQRCWD